MNPVNLFLDPIVTGKVVDVGTQQPLRGVEVRLFHTTDKPSMHLTNDRGEFRFSSLDMLPGRYFLQVTKSGYRLMISRQFWVTREGQTVVTLQQLKNGMMIVCE